ncbi:FkbM family methyltransferase [Spirosoma sp. HMF4905]|uniref:FkbM family methyltransferase n=1 Tax=Spirosoma arboris TaxID=2682092 RepID=A0A7K1S7E4_9BACT|nr:FkbM family methyltransferase [Spirosoma arboris]MVM29670.1 FkbM family methyltransferase [Spirosoma arboris]
MFNYLKESFARKKARRVTAKYPYEVNTFQLAKEGTVEFANWKNPLIPPKTITQAEINFFRRFATPGSFSIDVGANIGDTTVPMALAVGKNGLTLGFEPNPMTYEILEANAGLNKATSNIVPLRYAITEEEGEFFYSSSEASFGNGGVSASASEADQHGKFKLPEKVKGINLDKYLNENYKDYLPKLSLIKVDVEGHDKDVLRSISALIDQYKPTLIAECFSEATLDERVELYQIVANHDYTLYYFGDFDENTEISQIGPHDMNRWKNFNFYALPNSSSKKP